MTILAQDFGNALVTGTNDPEVRTARTEGAH